MMEDPTGKVKKDALRAPLFYFRILKDPVIRLEKTDKVTIPGFREGKREMPGIEHPDDSNILIGFFRHSDILGVQGSRCIVTGTGAGSC